MFVEIIQFEYHIALKVADMVYSWGWLGLSNRDVCYIENYLILWIHVTRFTEFELVERILSLSKKSHYNPVFNNCIDFCIDFVNALKEEEKNVKKSATNVAEPPDQAL